MFLSWVNLGSYKAFSSGQLVMLVSSSKVRTIHVMPCKAFIKEI